MKKILISILLFISFLPPAYSSEKIVYLDVEKIMQDSIAGKSIISQIKKKREVSISKLKKKEKEILDKTSNDITKLRIKASNNLINKLAPILEDYSKKNSIRIIVQKKNIVMGNKEDDITKDILELVNQKVKNIKLD